MKSHKFSRISLFSIILLLLTACVTSPPKQVDNICSIFKQKKTWYKEAKRAESKWGSSVATMMAIMHQESSFDSKARPSRTKLMGFIPWTRPSNAFGYPQALNSTWAWYKKSTGKRGADRDDFGDAIDFIGWYNDQTYRVNGIKKSDVVSLYLAYHEGHGGFKRRSYESKAWLKKVAYKVSRKAKNYKNQLNACEGQLKKGSSFWPF